ncbi:MAG TPA: deoxyribose-phosphate aldolase [Acidimicrobiia bacterium]|nr:deoxyribose-phosphate aldolase [Acidimicrobiia bacterium]
MTERDELIEAITREVLASLAGETWDECLTCLGDCVAHSAPKVRSVLAAGATRVTYNGSGADVPTDLAGFIDHTMLKPEATAAEIDRMCAEAIEYGFASVCVNPTWAKRVADALKGTPVVACCVVGFPLGASTPEIKAMEARRALRDGAREIDMVINVGALKSGLFDTVRHDIAGVSEACREAGALCKVILETALLSDEEKVIASQIAVEARADFVKTSTGFGPGGATVYDVALMREAVGPKIGVKASGGIRSVEDAKQMIAAGATRIGASAGIQIVTGGTSSGRY